MTTRFGSYDEDNFEIIEAFSKIPPQFDFDSKFVEVVESEYPGIGSVEFKRNLFTFSTWNFILDERNVILDAFALLGGNENLVNQVVDRLEDSSFRWDYQGKVKSSHTDIISFQRGWGGGCPRSVWSALELWRCWPWPGLSSGTGGAPPSADPATPWQTAPHTGPGPALLRGPGGHQGGHQHHQVRS